MATNKTQRLIVYLAKGVILALSTISSTLSGGLDPIEVFCREGGGKVIAERLPFSNDGLERAYPGTESGLLSWTGPLPPHGLFGGVLQERRNANTISHRSAHVFIQRLQSVEWMKAAKLVTNGLQGNHNRAPVARCHPRDTGLSRGRSRVQLRPDQHSGSLNNWGESAAFVITSANG